MAIHPKVREELHKIIDEVQDEEIPEAVYTLLERARTEPELSEEHKRMLDERLASHKANPDDVLDWEEVKANLEKNL
jgi:putative addiction module component (TIGR02574 family)